MPKRDYRDILSGSALILIGAFAAIHAMTSLRLGTLSQMGPGMFPAALGVTLVVFGIVILVPAIFRTGEALNVDVRSLTAISVSILAFAVMVRPFGLIPAVVALTLVVSRADSRLSPIATAIVAAGLSVGATLIFLIVLGMPITAISWPW